MSHSYPDPTAGRDGNGPFFNQTPQQTRRQSNEMELSQLAHEINPTMNTRQIVPQMGTNLQDPRQVSNGYPNYVTDQYQTPPQQLNHPDPNLSVSIPGQDPAGLRKKAKVSRACDECRRKKIRCEFPTENPAPNEKCSNCTRTTSPCQFSRMPQKRGPSKGYIKELADKLANLENHVMGAPAQPNQIMESTHSSPQASNELARIADMDYSRKRNHSVTEDLSPDYIGTERYPPPGGWNGQDGADQTPQYEAGYYPGGASQNGYTGVTQYAAGPGASMMSNGANTTNGHGQSSTQDTDNMNMDVTGDANWQWNEEVIDTYYKTVNRTLPLITSKKNLHHHLSNVSTAVREAFLEALYALMRQSSQNPYSHTHFTQIFQKVLELLTKSQVPELSGNESLHHLVRLQTAIIMVMTIDMTGPSKTLGLNRGSFFGIANGIAQELNLHINPTMTYTQNMIDSVEVVSRRAWWSLIVLDRWYAAGMAKPYQITDNASKLTPQDSQILGECFYHLARLSLVLGHISMSFYTVSSTPGLVSTVVAGELDRFRESVNDVLLNEPTLHIAFLHVQYLHERHTLGSALELSIIAANARTITSVLGGVPEFGHPIRHHFAGLAEITLIECTTFTDYRETSFKLQQDLQRSIEHKGIVSNGWAAAILAYAAKKKLAQHAGADPTIDRGGLQHLAEIAVGGTGADKADKSDEGSEPVDYHGHGNRKDWTAATRSGYLNTLS